ncbi:hypothetical protein BHM03_00024800 [Ensete ventricosum]|nr:hypothetical protein BHM03_00024800 [Ensete ventricosum]
MHCFLLSSNLLCYEARGELKDDEVSKAQLGAFFAGMTIRANAFPEPTQWSEGERRAMDVFWPHLVEVLPQDIIFIADPEGTIMESGNSIGSNYVGEGTAEMRLVGALREVLAGGHLGYEEVQGVLRDVLPLKSDDDGSAKASESLIAAFLIGQRMNRETDRELKAYCLAFDDDLGNAFFLTLEVWNGCHLRSELRFAGRNNRRAVAEVHGRKYISVSSPCKDTVGGMLEFRSATSLLFLFWCYIVPVFQDENVGFAYLNQKEVHPSLYSLIGLREHIKKRPPLATAEKVQQFVRVS